MSAPAATASVTAIIAAAMSQTVDTFLRAIDARDFEQRLKHLEAADAARR